MDIRNIKRFLALSDHKSFSKASEFLAISQPSLTREIQKMEEEVGRPLFVRMPTGVALTPTGEVYLSSFRKVVQELEQAQMACETLGEEIFGKINLAVHPILGRTVAPLLESVLADQPAVHLSYQFMNSRSAIEAVTEYRCDFAVVASTFSHSDIKKVKLWEENIELYSASGNFEQTIFVNQTMINAEKILKKFKKHRVRWVNDYDVLMAILENNKVMGLLPNTLKVQNSDLKSLQIFKPSFEISLIFRTDLEKTAAHQWLIQSLKEKCASL